MLLSARRAHLVVVDIQERLTPAIHGLDSLLQQTGILVRAAGRLDIPVTVTEQYPKGLGHTLPSVAAGLPESAAVVSKVTFACTGEPAFLERIASCGRDQLVLCGMEAHICVLQTALGLRQQGWAVAVVADAVSSRTPENAARGLARMAAHGVDCVTTEMVLFEWLERAGTPQFRELSALVK